VSFCRSCGEPLAGAHFCSRCGAPAVAGHPASEGTSGNAIASLVLGIVGLVFFPFVPSILAIVLGRSAKRDIQQRPGLAGEGMATAGIVLGWIGVILVVLGVVLLVLLLSTASRIE
jgi:Domain of unknown function (DUF4190)